MHIGMKAVGVARAEIGVNAANGEIHPRQFPGGGACARPPLPTNAVDSATIHS